jgi:hypothetical protein
VEIGKYIATLNLFHFLQQRAKLEVLFAEIISNPFVGINLYPVKWKNWNDLDWRKIEAPKELLGPLEASLDHLLITPPSHFRLQKVIG